LHYFSSKIYLYFVNSNLFPTKRREEDEERSGKASEGGVGGRGLDLLSLPTVLGLYCFFL
jgi:hypothetical protein